MLRLVSDENLPGDLIRGLRLREPDLDIVRVQEVGLRTADDPAILAWAAIEGRILLTKDRQTMIGYAYARVSAGQAMPGVIVMTEHMSIGDTIEQVLLAVICHDPEEMQDRVLFLPL